LDDASRLMAIAEIHALKGRYFRSMDEKDWAGLEAVFTPDCEMDFRAAAGGNDEEMLIRGASVYVARLAPMLADVVTVHHGHTPEIHIEMPDGARGIWAMEDKLWPSQTSALPFRRMHGYGHYHERYRRTADGWRIASIRLTRLHLEVE
jgi:hypothetical protein